MTTTKRTKARRKSDPALTPTVTDNGRAALPDADAHLAKILNDPPGPARLNRLAWVAVKAAYHAELYAEFAWSPRADTPENRALLAREFQTIVASLLMCDRCTAAARRDFAQHHPAIAGLLADDPPVRWRKWVGTPVEVALSSAEEILMEATIGHQCYFDPDPDPATDVTGKLTREQVEAQVEPMLKRWEKGKRARMTLEEFQTIEAWLDKVRVRLEARSAPRAAVDEDVRVVVDPKQLIAWVGRRKFVLRSEAQRVVLTMLVERPGVWTPREEFKIANADRVVGSLPAGILKRIEPKRGPGGGYRLV